MLEKLGRRWTEEEKKKKKPLHGWASAAVAVAVLGLLVSTCRAEEASCHGAYDLYFVLDK